MKYGMNLLLWATAVDESHDGILEQIKEIGYDGYLAFYMPQTSQQIFQSTPGIGYGKLDAAAIGSGAGKKSLLDYVSQPIRLLKEIEQTVELERDLYELDATRY